MAFFSLTKIIMFEAQLKKKYFSWGYLNSKELISVGTTVSFKNKTKKKKKNTSKWIEGPQVSKLLNDTWFLNFYIF